MNRKLINPVSASLICVALTACDTDFSNPVGEQVASAGDADFSTFVAVGDSLTAGFADAALYLDGQVNSYPNMLNEQFMMIGGATGGGTFTQPDMADNIGGMILPSPAPALGKRLVFDPVNRAPEEIAGTTTTDVANVMPGPYNNMGVPGAKSFHLGPVLTSYGDPAGILAGTANPYYVRMAAASNSSMIADAAALAPTFFVLWIGNNDILSYATSGGVGADNNAPVNTDPSTYGSNDITNTDVFAATFNGLVTVLTTNPATRGVLVNIPDVNAIPYFTTVPFNAVPLDQATADALNTGYAAYNAGVQSLVGVAGLTQEEADARQITFVEGQNAVVILDEDLTDLTGVNPPATSALINMRQATADDLIVLPALPKIGVDAGSGTQGIEAPMMDEDVLTVAEQASVEAARVAFNATIAAIADANPNLVLYDAASDLDELAATGISFGTGGISDDFVTGGGFSLDGVHPTARGYAVIANGIIDVINTGFNANVPPVDPGTKTTVFFK